MRVKSQTPHVKDERSELHHEALQDFHIEDEFLVARDETAFEPTGSMHDPVGSREERGHHRHHCLIGRLRVNCLRRVQSSTATEW